MHPEPKAKGPKIVERPLEHHIGEDRVHAIGVDRNRPPDAGDHRDGVADCKNADRGRDFLSEVEKEDAPARYSGGYSPSPYAHRPKNPKYRRDQQGKGLPRPDKASARRIRKGPFCMS